ncbi:MAG: glycine zipper 2TM domain-containing protein [Burkholderiales bacterium]
MQATDTRFRPLLALAAGSIIVLSAVGVAALPGMIPASKGETATPPVLTKPAAAQSAARKTVQRQPTVAAGQLAVVESVREVRDPGEAKGVGAVAGGVAGGVLGHKLGKKKPLVTVVGAAGGAFAGHQIEKHVRGEKRWEVAVRLEDGSQRTLSSEVQPAWQPGDRVRVVDNRLQPA